MESTLELTKIKEVLQKNLKILIILPLLFLIILPLLFL
ncbi:TPA: capsule biosynthesis protein CapA, partial [Staphylococcus aureus]|nr:capsule biosynthesis protein CapA [Staphylococcus aureus]